ncbi:MAG: tetratricopeptide repeat protein, partial [Dehalococcoidia bacterium]
YEEALRIHRDIGHRVGEASALGNMGNVYASKGELDKALDYYEHALRIEREIGHRQGEANHLANIGMVYAMRGDLDRALEHYQEALKIFETIGAYPQMEQVRRNIEHVKDRMKASGEAGDSGTV